MLKIAEVRKCYISKKNGQLQIVRSDAVYNVLGQKLKQLSAALTEEFGRGFSVQNLYGFRQFYLTFPEIFSTPWRILTWSHYKRIMEQN